MSRIVVVPLCFISLMIALGPSGAAAQPATINPDVSIDQAEINAGNVSLRKLVESGRHFFSTPYTTADGFSEGPAGPRLSRQALSPTPGYRFLRLNGLDSQSCFECHNSIGSINWRDTESLALSRKPGVNGGPAGAASNAFINDDFPTSLTKFIRNPPHVFGTGYGQRLAAEMTEDLFTQRQAARVMAQASPGTRIEAPLSSKGTDFGTFATTFNMGAGTFTDEFDGIDGVSEDLIVRPFQWKGIASTERNFVRDALNFHFSIQSVENFFIEDPMNAGQIIISETDNDADGVHNEMSVGNVTALTAFTVLVRPPHEEIDPGTEAEVARGRAIFEGTAGDIDFAGTTMCATCHTPSLRIEDPVMRIIDPSDPANLPALERGWRPTLGVAAASSDDLPPAREFARKLAAARQSPAFRSIAADPGDSFEDVVAAIDAELRAAERTIPPPSGLEINLNYPAGDLPPFAYPRLPFSKSGAIDVPLFSDLKRHDMGEALFDPEPQQTDAAGVFVPASEFLTRPLWGVADTGSWLFDGRAITLEEAILFHEGAGSEANPIIAIFRGLSEADRQAVITFLLTLRLPIESQFFLPGSVVIR